MEAAQAHEGMLHVIYFGCMLICWFGQVESEIKSLMHHEDLVRRRDAHVEMLKSFA